ncbi:MAG: PAS domain S-box protein [Bacteroidota bacterium]
MFAFSEVIREERHRRQHIFISACRVTVIVLSIFLLYYGLFDRSYNIVPMAVLLVIASLSVYLSRKARTDVAAPMMVWSTLIGLFSLASVNDGLYDTALLAIPALLLVAAMLLEKAHLKIYFLCVTILLIALGLYTVDHPARYPIKTMISITDIFDVTIINIATMGIVLLISTYLWDSLHKIKQAETKLLESEERFRILFDHSPEAYEVVDHDGRIVEVNSAMSQLGYTREEMLSLSIFEIKPEITPALFEEIKSTIMPMSSLHFESVHRRKDGSTFPVELSISSFHLNGVKNYIIESRDITERIRAEEALILTRMGLESASDSIFWVKPNGTIFDVNEAACRSLGYTREELLQLSVQEVDVHHNAEVWADHFPELRKHKTLKIESEHRTKAGKLISVEIVANYIQRGDEEYNCAFVRDITERKRTEEALRESEAKYRSLILFSSDPIFSFNPDGTYHFVNEAFARTFAKTPQEIIGKTPHYIYSEDEAEYRLALVRKIVQTKSKADIEVAVKSVSGKMLHFLTMLDPILDAAGNVMYVSCVSKNITDRKESEEKLRKSENKYRLLHESMSDGFVQVDMEGMIIDCNAAYQNIVGYTLDELRSMTYKDYTPSKWHKYESDIVEQQILKRGFSDVYEKEYLRKDGKIISVELHALLLNDEVGNSRNMWAIVRDIIERKIQENTLLQSQKLKSIGTLAGGIAHDFNNLLNAVLGQSSLALNKLPKESPAANHITKAIKASERVAELTKQLLAYSGKGRFVITEIDLNTLVKENVQIFEISIPKTAKIQYDFASPSLHIRGDIGQMQQVIMNLIINAGEAMDSNPGTITIRTNKIELPENNYEYSKYTVAPLPAGSYALLQVKDTGTGIGEETLTRIFEPFFSTKFTGRGLGLAAVLGIIKGHKGGIRIESEEGKGTTFEIVLPLIAPLQMTEVPQKEDHSTVNGKGNTILVIDDEASVIELLEDVLPEFNFNVISASDPLKGIEIYQREHKNISLVVLDYSMPNMDGKTTFMELLKINKDVKVLLCSGYSEEETLSVFGTERPAGYFQKPYKPKALVQRVAEIIS